MKGNRGVPESFGYLGGKSRGIRSHCVLNPNKIQESILRSILGLKPDLQAQRSGDALVSAFYYPYVYVDTSPS